VARADLAPRRLARCVCGRLLQTAGFPAAVRVDHRSLTLMGHERGAIREPSSPASRPWRIHGAGGLLGMLALVAFIETFICRHSLDPVEPSVVANWLNATSARA